MTCPRVKSAFIATTLLIAGGFITSASGETPKTIQPGKLTIAMNGDMPMTQLKDGKLGGTDGELFGTLLAQKTEHNWHSFADMKGHSVATVTGFTLVPELKKVDGIGEVKLYDTSDGVMQDLIAGRIDMAILDPPLMQYAIKEHPEWKLHQVALDPEPDKYPIMSTKYNVIFGVNKEEPELAEAMNAVIRDIWKECINVKTMANYGLGDKSWFIPPPKNPRVGVDRKADYAAPTADHCFK